MNEWDNQEWNRNVDLLDVVILEKGYATKEDIAKIWFGQKKVGRDKMYKTIRKLKDEKIVVQMMTEIKGVTGYTYESIRREKRNEAHNILRRARRSGISKEEVAQSVKKAVSEWKVNQKTISAEKADKVLITKPCFVFDVARFL